MATMLVAAGVLAVPFAGCGGGKGEQSTTGGTTTGATPAQNRKPSGKPSDQPRVVMASLKFAPETIRVRRGETVRWTNADPVTHTVDATAGATFSSGDVPAGQGFAHRLDQTGTISYVCEIHPGMTGKIIVSG